jgi:hypothetical protein
VFLLVRVVPVCSCRCGGCQEAPSHGDTRKVEYLSKRSRFAQCLLEGCGELEERDVAGARNIHVGFEFFRRQGTRIRYRYLCVPGVIKHSLSGVAKDTY